MNYAVKNKELILVPSYRSFTQGYRIITFYFITCFVTFVACFLCISLFLSGKYFLLTAEAAGPCWFCLGSAEVEKHLVVSVGDVVSGTSLDIK